MSARSLRVVFALVASMLLVLVAAPSALAAGGDADRIRALKRQVKQLKAENARLESELALAKKVAPRLEIWKARARAHEQTILAAMAALGGEGLLADRIASLSSTIGGDGTTVQAKVAGLQTALGGSGTLVERTAALSSSFTTINAELGGSGSPTDRAAQVKALVGGTGTVIDRINAVNTMLGGASDTTARVTALNTTLGGTGDAASRATTISNALGGAGANVTARVADLNGLLGGASATSTARATAILASIDNPAVDITSSIANVHVMLGGSGDTATRVEDIADELRDDADQTNLTDDVTDMRGLVNATPLANLEDDIALVQALLGGSDDLRARVDTINTIIGSGISTMDRLGDPMGGFAGLASYVRNAAPPVPNPNGFNLVGFYNATDYQNQIGEFLSVLNQSNAVATTQIQIPKTSSFTSLSDVLLALNHD